MQTVSKAQNTARLKTAPKQARSAVAPQELIARLEKHVLVDGLKLLFDAEKSRGARFVDATSGRGLIDFYSFYASQPIGFNHPYFDQPDVQADLLTAAKVKVSNSDVCTRQYAGFVETFARVMGLPPLERYFFIDTGTLAVENALKAAMDWKVRKNLEAGRGERGTEIIHFERAFHGRSGYCLSLTNTDPRKILYFAKFPWPRVVAPTLDFSLPGSQRIQAVAEKEKAAERQIREVLAQKGADIAAIILEPIQGEGGDNHFRSEFVQTLRRICDENEILLIFDEVQTGMGVTGKNWCCEHFGVLPDLLAFGKKAQVCGVMAGPRLDEIKDNCFRLSSRISSTWGGNFTDYVRSTHYLRIIEQENLVQNARIQGEYILAGIQSLARKYPILSAPRGRGLLLAFDLPDTKVRDVFWNGTLELGLLVVRTGERTVRLRPMLDIQSETIDEALAILERECQKLESS